jgi:hypothetical protein
MATRYEVLPVPARMGFTHLFAAGPIQIGVEYRLLNEEIIAEEYGEDSRAKFGNKAPPGLPTTIDEDGVSVHVFDAAARREFLRFDCFDDFPHYHYIDPDTERQTVHSFDEVADGPMDEWVIRCLYPKTLEPVLEEVAREIERARRSGHPIPVESTTS